MINTKFKTSYLISALIITGIFAVLSFISFNFFETIEKYLYGIGTRLTLSSYMGASRIAIVKIDRDSLDKLGPWPWPRSTIAEMIEILKDNGAKIIGIDLLYNEKESNQGLEEIEGLYKEITSGDPSSQEANAWIIDRLKEIETRLDNDSALVRVVKDSGNIIMPVSGTPGEYKVNLTLPSDNFLSKNLLPHPDSGFIKKNLTTVEKLTTPFQELAEGSHGLGHINLSPVKAMSGRIHLLFFDYQGNFIPSMAFRIALDYLGENHQALNVKNNKLQVAGTKIPADKGEMLIKFKGATGSFPDYSFVNILNVKKVPTVFNDKIVLIGYTAEDGPKVDTPVDHSMPRVEFTANVIENLLTGRYLIRPASMVFVEMIFLLFIIVFCSFVLPHTNQINRISIVGGFCIFVLLTGVIFFVAFDIWFKTVYIYLALITLYTELSIRDIIVSQKTLGARSKEMVESNRMLGLSFQSQGLLDLAFEKFRKCPLDGSMKDVIYNLGLDYERKRMINKSVAVYEYIASNDPEFRDLKERIPKLLKAIDAVPLSGLAKKEDKILVVEDLEIKPTVGRYEIIREIGQGAMGIVYEANDPKIQRRIAIKTIRFSDEFEEDRVKEIKARFLQEAEIAGKLSHPAIVSIFDVGEDYDLTYLAMEYLEGVDLRKHCNPGSILPLRKILYIISEVALALDYSHKQGVIHRDIKPGNIMLLKNGKVKVTDFGIAKAVSATQTKSGVILGTPNYMSPEQINGQDIDGRSDLFSLGAVMFEMLTGQVPFHGKNITNLLYEITQVKHPSIREINPKVPKVCEQVLDKALEKDPKDRFEDGAEFARYLTVMIRKIDEMMKK
ncbi:MAG: CHASE2 domain-containing protein [Deltaproteobacteria bacterium]|nr:CHASE2 domain-containing protein [Deltaproteobacteria bacterium]